MVFLVLLLIDADILNVIDIQGRIDHRIQHYRVLAVRIGGHAGTVNILQDKFYPVKKKANMVGIFDRLHKNAALFLRRISRPPLRWKAKRSRGSE